MGKVVATIEARLGSSRLPGKIFLDLAGKPVLLHIYERLAQARLVDQVVVATTDSTGDDPIEAFCQQHGVAYFRGSEHDVLKRVCDAGEAFEAELISEHTGDCPLVDPALVDECIELYRRERPGIVSTNWNWVYPEGVNAEIFSLKDLQWVQENISDPAVREHVSLYFYQDPERFKVVTPQKKWDNDFADWHLSLDEAQDLDFLEAIFKKFYTVSKSFRTHDVIDHLIKNEALRAINADVAHTKVI